MPHRYSGFFSLLLFAAILSACTVESIVDSPQERPDPDAQSPTIPRAAGYHAYWTDAAWTAYDFSSIDALFFFDQTVGFDGSISDRNGWPEQWTDLITTADASQTPIHVTVSILDANVYRSVFGSEVARARLMSELAAIASSESVSGLHLDVEVFEPTAPALRTAFTSFVETLAAILDADYPEVALSLFMVASDPSDVYDERSLASAVDFVIVQGYDLHWLTGDTAGPVAPLTGWGDRNWHTILARLENLGVERRKMLFAVPFYGYEWPTEGPDPGSRTRGPGRLTTYVPSLVGVPSSRDQALLHGLQRDPISGSPWYHVQDSTGWTQGWFEDSVSLGEKVRYLTEQGLGGMVAFPLAYGDSSFHDVLHSARMQP